VILIRFEQVHDTFNVTRTGNKAYAQKMLTAFYSIHLVPALYRRFAFTKTGNTEGKYEKGGEGFWVRIPAGSRVKSQDVLKTNVFKAFLFGFRGQFRGQLISNGFGGSYQQ
jgi:hypothetical protein